MIKVGTSGFSYDDWKGTFYPPDISSSGMLPFYASHFDCVELNVTYYRLLEEKHLARMVRVTNGAVVFAVKAHREMTHVRTNTMEDTCHHFMQMLKPLMEASVLGAVLLQFPHSFTRNPVNEKLLGRYGALLPDVPLVVEFRHRSWLDQEVFDLLQSLEMGICCVDEPALPGLMPPRADVTSKIAYVRFHGRNARSWWNHEQAWERYHYLYSREELVEWVTRLREMEQLANTVYLFANNHYQGNAATNACMMKDLLGIAAMNTAFEPPSRQHTLDLDAYE